MKKVKVKTVKLSDFLSSECNKFYNIPDESLFIIERNIKEVNKISVNRERPNLDFRALTYQKILVEYTKRFTLIQYNHIIKGLRKELNGAVYGVGLLRMKLTILENFKDLIIK